MEAKLKELRQAVARISNEIHRRKIRRKLSKKESKILNGLREKAQVPLTKKSILLKVKEKWLEELRYLKIKLEKTKTKDERIRDNNMFRDDQSKFYRSINTKQEQKGKVPNIDKFVNFWAGIWEDGTTTPHKEWMRTVAQKIREKVRDIVEIEISEESLHATVRKRKNWSSSGIDGIQNYWWKKFIGARKSMVQCMKRWIEDPEQMPRWITDGRTVLLPKTEDLGNERNYRPITCLNTCYKIFTGIVATYMKEHR